MSGERRIPRVLIAGTSSGVGKTTLMVGLALALRARGLRVASFKCGPDYLDPTYHRRATGSPCHNLDGWLMGRDAVLATFERTSRQADIALIEGVMGLFDGASATSEEGSAAQVAKWLETPVLLVIDAQGMARSIAAVAQGFAAFDPEVDLQGVVANRVGSRGHLDLLRAVPTVVPVFGGLPNKPEASFPERHLGLQTAHPEAIAESQLATWGRLVEEWVDIPALLALAHGAPPVAAGQSLPHDGDGGGDGPRIGIAVDEAFHFYYDANLALLETLGAELVRFSPLHDPTIPKVDGLYLGGGYPEVVAAELSANRAMIASIRTFAEQGGPIYAECGGLMYLSRAIQTVDATRHPMVGLIDGEVVVRDTLQALGYVEVETRMPTLLGPAGLRFRGHQFRYSELVARPTDGETRYEIRRRRDGVVTREGFGTRNVLASFVHAHWASCPEAAAGLVRACVVARRRRDRPSAASSHP